MATGKTAPIVIINERDGINDAPFSPPVDGQFDFTGYFYFHFFLLRFF